MHNQISKARLKKLLCRWLKNQSTQMGKRRKTKGKHDSTVINNLKEILTRRERRTGET